jgi:hypothetical protein
VTFIFELRLEHEYIQWKDNLEDNMYEGLDFGEVLYIYLKIGNKNNLYP